MNIAVFGASGGTGLLLVEEALKRGHGVRAVVRRPEGFLIRNEKLTVIQADVMTAPKLSGALSGCDGVASTLGASYSRKPISIYSKGTEEIVAAMRDAGCRRLIVVSSGLTYPPPPGYGFLFDKILHPLLHNVIGRTLYADMRAMEEFLRAQPDIDWTAIRPGRLVDGDTGQPYRKEPDRPTRRYTTRIDLARCMLDDLESGADLKQAVAVSSR